MGGLLALGLVALVVRDMLNKIFLLNMRHPLTFVGKGAKQIETARYKLYLRDEEAERRRLEKDETGGPDKRDKEEKRCVVDQWHFKEKSSTYLEGLIRANRDREVVLEDFETGLEDPAVATKKLLFLEGLFYLDVKAVTIHSKVDPLYFLLNREQGTGAGDEAEKRYLERWSAVLASFMKIRGDVAQKATDEARARSSDQPRNPAPHASGRSGEGPGLFSECLKREASASLTLKRTVDRLAPILEESGKVFKHLDGTEVEGHVVDQVLDLAKSHYQTLWTYCSKTDRLLLYRLAREGWVNWKMKDSVRSLIRRRLVVADPNFRLMNESFRRFVLQAERPEVYLTWEKEESPSTWSKVRLPIIVFCLVLAGFFFATQREAFDQTIGILAALAASIPAVVKILGGMMPTKRVPIPEE